MIWLIDWLENDSFSKGKFIPKAEEETHEKGKGEQETTWILDEAEKLPF